MSGEVKRLRAIQQIQSSEQLQQLIQEFKVWQCNSTAVLEQKLDTPQKQLQYWLKQEDNKIT